MKLSSLLSLLGEVCTVVEKLGIDTEPLVASLSPKAGAIAGAVIAGAGIGQAVLTDVGQAAAQQSAASGASPAAANATAAATAQQPAPQQVQPTAATAGPGLAAVTAD